MSNGFEDIFKKCVLCGIPFYTEGPTCPRCLNEHGELPIYNPALLNLDFKTDYSKEINTIFNPDIKEIRLPRR